MSATTDAIEKLIAQVALPTAGFTLPTPLPAEPFGLFQSWFDEEVSRARTPNPNAMSLATQDADGTISTRIVLCRGIDAEQGAVTFFTNYQGRKGRALLATGRAAVCFHWDEADKQVRLEGRVVQSGKAESDAYFRARRWESKLSAWVSDQSASIASREALLAKVPGVLARLGLDAGELLERGNQVEIPRPAHWGGFRLYARRVELWLGGTGRLHDRAVWEREVGEVRTVEDAARVLGPRWVATRLQP
jgi:pyridoxamine 5'-phosphate oxidase